MNQSMHPSDADEAFVTEWIQSEEIARGNRRIYTKKLNKADEDSTSFECRTEVDSFADREIQLENRLLEMHYRIRDEPYSWKRNEQLMDLHKLGDDIERHESERRIRLANHSLVTEIKPLDISTIWGELDDPQDPSGGN